MHPRFALRTLAAGFLLVAVILLAVLGGSRANENPVMGSEVWTCSYITATPQGPLQIMTTFEVVGDDLAEIDTIPKGLNFSDRYKILENTDADLVAAISITKFSDHPPPGIGAVLIIIAKQNGLFQQSGSILGLRTGDPTLGHCDRQ